MKPVIKKISSKIPNGFDVFSATFDINESILIPIYSKVLRSVNIVGKGLI
jgi:hypothetical protein